MLPDDFATAPQNLRYLYRQTISVDCNFRLKNRHRATNVVDIRLSPGWAYMVEKSGYMDYVQRHANQAEVRLHSLRHLFTEKTYIFIEQHVLWLQCNDTCKPEKGQGAERYWGRRRSLCST